MSFYRLWLLTVIFLACLSISWMAASYGKAAEAFYVVEAEAALLRDHPSPESGILARLQRLDQVEFLEANTSGWWKVRSLKTGVEGWMTSDLLAAAPTLPAVSSARTEYFYVNTSGINLRALPLHSSASMGTVKLNDRVEKLASSPEGWTKVRNPRDGKQGWLPTRTLSPKLVLASPVAAAAKKRVKRAVPAKKKPKTEKPAPVAVPEIPKPM